MHRKSKNVQQWVDSLPTPVEGEVNDKEVTTNTKETVIPELPRREPVESPRTKNSRGLLFRDASLQSDDASSYCSSVESVLELRKPDPEAILLGLGFGPSSAQNEASRIPRRFLHPSQVSGVNVDRFLQEQQEADVANCYCSHNFSSLNIGQQFRNETPKSSHLEPSL